MATAAFSQYITQTVYPEMCKVSLALALMIVLTMITLTIYDKRLVDRVTLRLQTAISCYDIWAHAIPLWSRKYNYEGSPLCVFIAYQGLSLPLLYCFLNVAIGINLQLVFIHGIYVTKKIEAAYWIGSILLTLIITIPSLASGLLGFGKFMKCYLATNDEDYIKKIDFYANILIMIICMVYLLGVTIAVAIKLYRGLNVLKNRQLVIDASESNEAIKYIRLLTSRILLYPILMLISHSGLIFSQAAYDLAGINSHELAIYSYITGGLLGTLNFIAFCCDPTIQHALKIIYYRVVKKREIEMFQPNKSSYNDAFESKEAENNDKASKFDSETVDQKAIQYHKFIRTL